jgi:single-strand DNA-binding protein
MASYNRVIVVGNLTRDPELQYTGGGQAVCKFSIACNERYTDKSGQKVEKVHFFDVTAWAKTAELVSQYLKKGRSALVEGKLAQDRWDDKDSGAKRSKVYIVAERVQFLGGKPEGEGAAGEGAPAENADAAVGQDEVPF